MFLFLYFSPRDFPFCVMRIYVHVHKTTFEREVSGRFVPGIRSYFAPKQKFIYSTKERNNYSFFERKDSGMK